MKVYITVLFWIYVITLPKSDAKTNRKCYGSAGLRCTTHRLRCNNTKVINITKAEFGYRPGCNSIGLSSCQNTNCCKEKNKDCFLSFTDEEFQNVSSSCTGQQDCTVEGMRRYDNVNKVCNGREVSAYSRLEYTCVSPEPLTTTTTTQTTTATSASTKQTTSAVLTSASSQTPTTTFTTASALLPTTPQRIRTIETTETDLTPSSTAIPDNDKQVSGMDDSNNTGGIVGGIVGTIIVIAVVVIVIILYRRNVQQKSNSEVPKTKTNKTNGTVDPHYFTVDDAATLNRKVTSQYDEIDLDGDTTPQYSEGYDHILAQQIKASKSKQNNNSNHIGGGTGGGAQIATDDDYNLLNRNKIQKFDPALAVTYQNIGEIPDNNSKNNLISEDNYQHIGEIPANSSKNNLISEDNYQHIGEIPANSSKNNLISEDNYQHIGGNSANSSKNNLITEDNYQHIGEYPANVSKNNFITEDDYQHIGENPANNFKDNLISEDNYQHIGENPANSSKNNFITDDNYQHIGLPEVQLNQDSDDYNHIGNVMISRDTTITKNTDNNSGSVTPRTFRPNSEYQLAYSPNGGDVKQTGGYEIATLVENQNTESDYELVRKSDC